MSEMTTTAPEAGGPGPAPQATLKAELSLTRVAIRETLRPWMSRVAMAWIGVMVFVGLYAPFVANSFPYLAMKEGKVISPLWQNLDPWDIAMALIVPLGALCVWVWKKTIKVHAWGGILLAAALASLAFVFVTPKEARVYNEYRVGLADGTVTWVINAPIPYSKQDFLQEQSNVRYLPPSWQHWMGTEGNGGDICAMIVHACRIAMSTGLIASTIALVIGVVLGGLMGYFSGWVDLVGMRILEVVAAIPTMYLILMVMAAFSTRNIYVIMVIIGFTSWYEYAVFTRAEFLRLRTADFVQAGVAAGLPLTRVLFGHILPNGLAPILINFTFGVAGATLSEAGLSFIGLGDANNPSWGGLLNQAVSGSGGFYWWLATFPGLAIFATIFCYNVLGEALRDGLDPRLAHSR
jgi:peptide/nickel transport system permease protein